MLDLGDWFALGQVITPSLTFTIYDRLQQAFRIPHFGIIMILY